MHSTLSPSVHVRRKTLGGVPSDVGRGVLSIVPMIDLVAIGDSIAPPMYGPYRADPEWDAVFERLDRAMPVSHHDVQCTAARRTGHRASRVARTTARKAAKSSGDSDGEPPIVWSNSLLRRWLVGVAVVLSDDPDRFERFLERVELVCGDAAIDQLVSDLDAEVRIADERRRRGRSWIDSFIAVLR